MVEQGPLGEQDYEQLGDLVSCCEEQHVAQQLQKNYLKCVGFYEVCFNEFWRYET